MQMPPAEYEPMLAQPNHAVISVQRGEGRAPHATPVWYIYGDGRFYVSLTKRTVKYRLMQAQPEISLTIDSGGPCVIAEGTAAFREDDQFLLRIAKELNALYRDGAELAPDDELLAERKADERTVLVLEPSRIKAWGA
jgi:hypothetical protein